MHSKAFCASFDVEEVNMDYLDILVFAAMAVFVLARLWSVLGRRDDNETQRQNPFAAPLSHAQDEEDVVVMPEGARAQEGRALLTHKVAPTSLAGVLDQIKTLDPTFDEKQFIQGAKAAFTRILEGFAKGDLSSIAKWLAPTVLDSFQGAITARREAGQTLESRLDRIAEADISAARLEDSKAFLTVDFTSHQINVTRNAQGNVIDGKPDHAEEIRDVWIFSRDIKSNDPNWLLVETRS